MSTMYYRLGPNSPEERVEQVAEKLIQHARLQKVRNNVKAELAYFTSSESPLSTASFRHLSQEITSLNMILGNMDVVNEEAIKDMVETHFDGYISVEKDRVRSRLDTIIDRLDNLDASTLLQTSSLASPGLIVNSLKQLVSKRSIVLDFRNPSGLLLTYTFPSFNLEAIHYYDEDFNLVDEDDDWDTDEDHSMTIAPLTVFVRPFERSLNKQIKFAVRGVLDDPDKASGYSFGFGDPHSYPHPHITHEAAGGDACFGTYRNMIESALMLFDFDTLDDTIWKFLHTYNPHDPYLSASEFSRISEDYLTTGGDFLTTDEEDEDDEDDDAEEEEHDPLADDANESALAFAAEPSPISADASPLRAPLTADEFSPRTLSGTLAFSDPTNQHYAMGVRYRQLPLSDSNFSRVEVLGWETSVPVIAPDRTPVNPITLRPLSTTVANPTARGFGSAMQLGDATLTGTLGVINPSSPRDEIAQALTRINISDNGWDLPLSEVRNRGLEPLIARSTHYGRAISHSCPDHALMTTALARSFETELYHSQANNWRLPRIDATTLGGLDYGLIRRCQAQAHASLFRSSVARLREHPDSPITNTANRTNRMPMPPELLLAFHYGIEAQVARTAHLPPFAALTSGTYEDEDLTDRARTLREMNYPTSLHEELQLGRDQPGQESA